MADNIYITTPQNFVVVDVPLNETNKSLYVTTPRDVVTVDVPRQTFIVVDMEPIRGPDGQSSPLARYLHSNVQVVSGEVVLDVNTATSFLVDVTEDINTISVSGWPTNTHSQFVSVYFKQDSTGYHSVTGWPLSVRWGGTLEPDFSEQQPYDIGHVMLHSYDQGNTVFGTLIAMKYE